VNPSVVVVEVLVALKCDSLDVEELWLVIAVTNPRGCVGLFPFRSLNGFKTIGSD
jgi:hypothetical protein